MDGSREPVDKAPLQESELGPQGVCELMKTFSFSVKRFFKILRKEAFSLLAAAEICSCAHILRFFRSRRPIFWDSREDASPHGPRPAAPVDSIKRTLSISTGVEAVRIQ